MNIEIPRHRSYGYLADCDLRKPAGAMWMVLSLAGLHEDAPPHGDALDDTQQAIMYNAAVSEAVRAFSPLHTNFTSTISNADKCRRENAVMMLRSTREQYHGAANTPPDVAIMSKFLYAVFADFYQQIVNNPVQTPLDPYSAYTMEHAVAGLMHELLHNMVKELITVTYRKTVFVTNKAVFNDVFRLGVCQILEDYIECKMDIPEFHGLVPRDNIGKSVVQLIQPLLQEHMHEAGSEFFDLVGFGTEHEILEDSPDMDVCLEELYLRIGSFFGFRSSLLEDFWPEPEPEVVPEYIAHHDFEQYEDDDWYEREYQLYDRQDVLRGPDQVTADDVSIPVEAAENFDLHCGLCHDVDTSLRELKVCGHEFCEDCLSSQLQAQHECRYKCALCRAEFFAQNLA